MNNVLGSGGLSLMDNGLGSSGHSPMDTGLGIVVATDQQISNKNGSIDTLSDRYLTDIPTKLQQ